MSSQQAHLVLNNLAEAIATFLASPPVGTPTEVITAFGEAMLPGNSVLAPRLFYEAVEQAPIAISITDLTATILYVNPAFEQVTGYTCKEIAGQNHAILSDKHTPPEVYTALWQQLEAQKTWTGVLLNKTKTADPYLAEVTITPVLNTADEVVYYLGMHRDVTAEHHLKQQVHSQKKLIETVVDSARVIIVLVDENGQIILDNHEYKKLVGDLRGQEPVKIFLKNIRDNIGQTQCDKLRLTEGSFMAQEVRIDLSGGHLPRWFACSGTWFRERDNRIDAFFDDRKKSYLLLVANEVTEFKRQQEEVRLSALRTLLAEEKLIEGMRETLTASIHQFQVPLNLITAAVNMLERRPGSHYLHDPLYDVLKQALDSGKQTLDNLRQHIPNVFEEANTMMNLNELLRDVLTLSTQRLLAEGITVDWQPALVLPKVLGRICRLRSLFKQLIDNALDAMHENRCSIRELRITTIARDDAVIVTIADTGIGIPEHLRLKVFEPFFTTAPGKRTGMGLASVQEIVNLHAGAIHIEPNYTEGCCFVVQLPIASSHKSH